jgi:hypothetical protein
MSKKLVAVHNYTDKDVWLSGRDGNVYWQMQAALKKGKHDFSENPLNIPDNSDSSKYFEEHHISVNIAEENKTLHSRSFWDDDWDNYKIKYCYEENWSNGIYNMDGGDKGGDGTPVVLHIINHPVTPGTYQLSVVALTPDENRKKIAAAFKNFKQSAGVSASGKYSSADIHGLMKHPAFGAVRQHAADSGFGSIGLVFGTEQSLAVGKEHFKGVIVGFGDDGVYEIESTAYTVGAEEGDVLFAGLYMSTEPPAKAYGFDIFAEIAVDVEDIGFAFSLFITLGGGGGFMALLTDGEELEVSVGAGYTSVTQI